MQPQTVKSKIRKIQKPRPALFSILALTLTVHPLANEDVLEPSVANEVDHALSRAPTNVPSVTALPLFPTGHVFATNGLSRTAIAIRLVSAQRADGRWYAVWNGRTNDMTAVAVERLERCRE